MSLYDYQESLKISAKNPPFYALIMAAMRRADTSNTQSLILAFPDTWKELRERYNAPGGLITLAEIEQRAQRIKEQQEGSR